MKIIHPGYFNSIISFSKIIRSKNIIFENYDNFQKQTYRNRTYIYGPNGKQTLTIPVNYSQKERSLYKDVKINNLDNWQIKHWRSFETAYKTSPFFEFYEDDLKSLYFKKYDFLYEFNIACFQRITECLDLDMQWEYSKEFIRNYESETNDLRSLINSKKEPIYNLEKYTQVFESKHGFIENLSILDLMFNEGPNATYYLENL